MQLLPLNELLKVNLDGLELVVDNASSPIYPASFRKNSQVKRSVSGSKGRWGDTVSAPPPLIQNVNTASRYLHSSMVTNLLRSTSLDSASTPLDSALRPPVRRDSHENLLRLTGGTEPVPLQKYGSDSLLRIPRRQYSQERIMGKLPSECSRLRLMPSDPNKNQNGDTLLTLLGHRRNRSSLLDSNELDDQILPITKCPTMHVAHGQRNADSLEGFQPKLQMNPPSA